MKGKQHPKNDLSLNPSGNPSIHDVLQQVDTSRRQFVRGGRRRRVRWPPPVA